jgi:PAS domain S-box-containing protein
MARILIVEDERLTALDLREALTGLGHTVVGMAASGQDAIRLSAQMLPDLVLMDIYLEGEMDGVAATHEIYQQFQIPVIYLTAYTDNSTLQRALATYPFGYLSKPWQESSLKTSIAVTLQRSQMEQTVLAKMQTLTQTLYSIPEAAIATDAVGTITQMNPTAENLTGWSRQEAIGLPVEQVIRLIHGKTREPVSNPLLQAMQQNHSVRIASPCLLLTKDGNEVPVGDQAAPIRNDVGEIQGSVAVIQQLDLEPAGIPGADMQQALVETLREQTTQLQQAIACLQRLQRILSQTQEVTSPTSLFQTMITEIGMALAADYCWVSLRDSGYATATVIADYVGESYGGNTLALSTQLDATSAIAYYNHLEATEFWLAPPTASLPALYQPIVSNPALVLICPLRDEQYLIGDVGICLPDPWTLLGAEFITQLIHQCVTLMRQRLSTQPKTKTSSMDPDLTTISIHFISALSAQLQTPMTNIRMVTEVMRQIMTSLQDMDSTWENTIERQSLWQKMEQYLQILYNEWQQEFHLLNDLLSVQVAVLPQDTTPSQIQLSDWLPPVVAPIARQASRRQQTLRCQLEGNLPTITLHAASLERIVIELLSNACKHSPIGQQITLSVRVIDQTLELRVTNTGVEIPTPELSKVFEPFHRLVYPHTHGAGGLGLGLTLVKKLIVNLGGDVKVEKPRANTTSFVVVLPMAHHQGSTS